MLREVPSEAIPGRGGRVERRAAGPTGRRSFVSIHTRPTVPRNPPPEVYRVVRDARKTNVVSDTTWGGKGLNIFSNVFRPRPAGRAKLRAQRGLR